MGTRVHGVLGVLLCVSAIQAQVTVEVPGDFATIQDAIDNVPPDSTIVVHGGTHSSIVIDKPLTLVGDPMPLLQHSCCTTKFGQTLPKPAILLAGSGSGTVRLVRVKTGGFVGFSAYEGVNATIQGTGFARLEILHSTIDAPDSFDADPLPGTDAIDVSIPDLLISDSQVTGGDSEDGDGPAGLSPLGGTAIRGVTVTLLDSLVSGGKAHDLTFNTDFFTCPSSCTEVPLAVGGAGVVAQSVFVANSAVTGGVGAKINCFTPDPFDFHQVCTKPSGADIVAATVVPMTNSLTGSGELQLGSPWMVAWFSVGNPCLLLASAVPIPPVKTGGHGWLFLDANAALIIPVPGGGIINTAFTVPSDSSLIGREVVLQIFDPGTGQLTRPVATAFVP